MSKNSTEELTNNLSKLDLQDGGSVRRSDRRRQLTDKGRALEAEKLQMKKKSLKNRIQRKMNSIEELLYSKDNEITVRDEIHQLNDIITMVQDIYDNELILEKNDEDEESFDVFDEKMCTFKHKVHNWLRKVAEERDEAAARSNKSSQKTNSITSRRSSSCSRSSKSSRANRLEEKIKLAELETEAIFMKAKAEMKMKTEQLEIEEKIAKTRARVNVMETEEGDVSTIEDNAQEGSRQTHQRTLEWDQNINSDYWNSWRQTGNTSHQVSFGSVHLSDYVTENKDPAGTSMRKASNEEEVMHSVSGEEQYRTQQMDIMYNQQSTLHHHDSITRIGAVPYQEEVPNKPAILEDKDSKFTSNSRFFDSRDSHSRDFNKKGDLKGMIAADDLKDGQMMRRLDQGIPCDRGMVSHKHTEDDREYTAARNVRFEDTRGADSIKKHDGRQTYSNRLGKLSYQKVNNYEDQDPRNRSFPKTSKDEIHAVEDHRRLDAEMSTQLCQLLKQQSAPDIQMEVFTGNPTDYEYFTTMFREVVEKRVDDQVGRLMRLLKFTDGEAKELIKHCVHQPTTTCYDNAKDLLRRQYGNPHRILAAYRDQINNLAPIKANDSQAFKKLFTFLLKIDGIRQYGNHNPLDNADTICKVLSRLPNYLQDRWNRNVLKMRKVQGKEPSLKNLLELIEDEMKMADDPLFSRVALNKQGERAERFDKRRPERVKNFYTAAESQDVNRGKYQKEIKCPICSEKHYIDQCKIYRELSVAERAKKVFSLRLCFKCLKSTSKYHTASTCKYPKSCAVCNQEHPTSLHGLKEEMSQEIPSKRKENTTPDKTDSQQQTDDETTILNTYLTKHQVEVVSLCIVPIQVKNPLNQTIVDTYAMLDSCSQGSFMADGLKEKLTLQGIDTKVTLKTVNGEMKHNTVAMKDVMIKGKEGNSRWLKVNKVFSQREIPVTTEDMASAQQIEKWDYLRDILEKMKISKNVKVEMLIGANCPQALEPHQFIQSRDGGPYALKTLLGWCVIGPTTTTKTIKNTKRIAAYQTHCKEISHHHFQIKNQVEECSIKELIQKMYNNDFIENDKQENEQMSGDDKRFLKIVEEGSKMIDGKHQVPLPLRNKDVVMPNNRNVAERRFAYLQQKLKRDDNFSRMYFSAMQVMLDKGYAEPARKSNQSWYIPHHGVIHPAKPGKVRVVFDASAEYQGQCINKELFKGPDLTNQLVGVLMRYREEEVVVTADIEAMFYQVKIPPNERCLFKFLWFKNNDATAEVCEYQMTAHIFGGTSSPSCANYALRKTARENKKDFNQEVVKALYRNFYVDDLLKSLPSIQAAKDFVDGVKKLCQKGGFNLTKFSSNKAEVLEAVKDEDRKLIRKHDENVLEKLPEESALGMKWNVQNDTLSFKMNQDKKPVTRRGILSTISSIYDPLGLIAPFLLDGKKILQKICKLEGGWDSAVPENIKQEWLQWKKNLKEIEKITIKRCVKEERFGAVQERSLHIFADASDKGYGIACYLRQKNENEEIQCALIYGRSRVAPMKFISIPRMELTAAVLAAKTSKMILREMDQSIDKIYFWTDSKAVLGYISNESRQFKIFVANRVQQIQDFTDVTSWQYVPTKENPADHASRGLYPRQVNKCSEWFNGPAFLWETNLNTNDDEPTYPVDIDDVEIRNQLKVNSTVIKDKKCSLLDKLTERTNSWSKLIKIVVLIRRYIKKLRRKIETERKDDIQSSMEEKIDAENTIIKLLQKSSYEKEIQDLEDQQIIKKSSSLLKLNPFLDNGILKVGGRLSNSNLPAYIKHPIILPKKHPVTKMIADFCHKKVAHAGRNSTANEIRQNGYWVINGNSLIRKLISECVICRKLFNSWSTSKNVRFTKRKNRSCCSIYQCWSGCIWTIPY